MLAYGQIFVIQVVRKPRYCCRIWLGFLDEIWQMASGAQTRRIAHAVIIKNDR